LLQFGVTGWTLKRVMILDAHDRIRELLVELLGAESDLKVVAACADDAQGVDVADRVRPDVVVLAPDLLSDEVVANTRRIVEKCPEAKVLVLTVAPHGQLAADLAAVGARTCLAKSAPYTRITKAIRSG